ncbi:uncharacterized protein LOC120012729 isoform X2 [Tripterygium wilfordii]|uniref:uncharacterized protein LOC120012729 isoform X2 n=1 Tax=Tripterygium wilfordii TaxID=458696 RepID=UPI0018F85DFA|nr:uncharacterized protein LOC120012729 isoform X2 [Tripterygium wilfordii]
MEIQHISHKHKLVFTSDDGGEGHGSVSCYGCRRPIVGGRYRCCTESCNFFLDKTCAELPGQILVVFHRLHYLTLRSDERINRLHIKCSFCQEFIEHPFYYDCHSNCRFIIHIKCTLLLKSHEHNFIVLMRPEDFTCDACGIACDPYFMGSLRLLCTVCQIVIHEQCKSLQRMISILQHHHALTHTYIIQENGYFQRAECTICRKQVNTRCATLPQKVFFYDKPLPQIVWPKDYDQPSILTYKSIDKGYDEYYCDICETERDPHHWFYYCENYDCCGHPKCTLGKYPYIKRGSQFQLWSLLFFLRSLEGYSFCDDCSRFCSINQLPLTVESDFHTHTLTLAYKPSCDRDSNRNFCDLCKKFHAEHLLYYCGKCKFQVHPQCVFHREVIYSQAKNLIFYERSMGYLRCLVCGEDCKGLSLKCQMSECNFSIHFDCRRGLRDIIPKDLQRLPQALG